MTTNCTMEQLKGFKFGYAYMGTHKAMKMRYKTEMATAILKRLPAHFHRHISVFITLKGYTFIACVADQQSAIWYAIDSATTLAKADVLRDQAALIEVQHKISMS